MQRVRQHMVFIYVKLSLDSDIQIYLTFVAHDKIQLIILSEFMQ